MRELQFKSWTRNLGNWYESLLYDTGGVVAFRTGPQFPDIMLDLFPLSFSRDVKLHVEVLTAGGASFRVFDMSRHMPLLSGPSSSAG